MCAIPTLATTQEDANTRAAQLAEEAQARFERGDINAAIDLFQEAMSYVRDPAFAFNIAYLYEQSEASYPAYRYYTLYLDLYPGAPNRTEVAARLTDLESLFRSEFAELVVTTSPPGAAVFVTAANRRDRYGETPFEGYAPAGAIVVSAELDGYLPAERVINAVASVRLEVDLGPLVTVPEAVEPPSDGTSQVWGWALVAGGAALAGTGGVFWALAQASASDYDDRVAGIGVSGAPVTLDELRALSGDAEDQARLGNVLFGVGGAILTGGIVLLLLSAGDQTPPEPEDSASLQPEVRIVPGGVGFQWSGRF